MAQAKFNGDVRARAIEAIASGASQPDAALYASINPGTLQRWLRAGRDEPDGPYGQFAQDADAALLIAKLRAAAGVDMELPMDRGELKLAVSQAARRGSVQHQKLMRDLLLDEERAEGLDEPVDPLAEFDGADEVAARREAKAGK